jgi:hypothetical protein
MAQHRNNLGILMTIMLLATMGCRDQTDSRVENAMRESLVRQAEQNRQVAEQSRVSTEAVRDFVEAESAARTEVVGLQRDIVERDSEERQRLVELSQTAQRRMSAERAVLDKQRANLEAERQQLAAERNRDPIIAETIAVVGMLMASTIPLLLAGYVLHTLDRGSEDESVVNEILVNEISVHCPGFLATENPRLANERVDPILALPESD